MKRKNSSNKFKEIFQQDKVQDAFKVMTALLLTAKEKGNDTVVTGFAYNNPDTGETEYAKVTVKVATWEEMEEGKNDERNQL